MYALMIAFLSIAIVGATVTMQRASEVTDLVVSEKVVAGNFNRYAGAVRCYARANPAYTGAAPTLATLKATTHEGVPCLSAQYTPMKAGAAPAPVGGGLIPMIGQAELDPLAGSGSPPPPVPVAAPAASEFLGWITTNDVIVYAADITVLRGMPSPTSAIYQHAGTRYARIGVISGDGVSIVSPGGGVVGVIPPELASAGPSIRPKIGAPIRILSKS